MPSTMLPPLLSLMSPLPPPSFAACFTLRCAAAFFITCPPFFATSWSCCIFLLRCCECNCAFILQFSALHCLLYCQSHCTMHRAPLYAKCVVFMSIAQRRKRPCRCFVAIVLRLAQLSAAPQIFPAIPRIFMSALRSQSTNDELAAAAVRPFCPSRRVFSSPQRKVCIAAAVVGSHSTLFHAQPSQSSRTISDSTPTIPPRALSTRTSAHFFFHNLYSPSLPAISNQILHASC